MVDSTDPASPLPRRFYQFSGVFTPAAGCPNVTGLMRTRRGERW
jgi:hypothetical protein